ncbi:diguanylate cyclase [Uliginosibacterium sp. 31-12]|uniref:sensor domain-containing diguanylate cyclase n=1 Tax=Uliginosibacterium sp. 31-12 TaxID=3062781 RepID=UPI0026E170B2|nr:diguanylate cyclase [Uliginosibacterium sp. 31-12]MDO6384932.1 diguanylate cyclase [Uliginosibacterium sp. 31-12]
MAPPIDVSRFEQLKASGDLPSPKGVALAVMRMTQLDECSMAELAQLIRTDPAFVGRLIKAANGVIGYGRRPVVSVQDALTVLGMPAVRNMALGFSLLNNHRSGACEGFDYGRYWSTSLLSAVALQAVTLRTRVAAPDETYCLGLLARVGELALATLYPHDYAVICHDAGGDIARLLALESRSFAMTNAELGAAMLADWGLPRLFTDAAFCVASGLESSHPEGSRDATLSLSLSLARQMSVLCMAPEAERPAMMQSLKMAGSRLSFDEEAVAVLADGVVAEWVEWGALLHVHAEQLPPFERLLRPPSPPLSVAVEATTSPDGTSPVSRALRVLLVDAVDEVRQELRQVLLEAGYEVAEARDGFSATELALDFCPDMMLLGWQMPDVSATELLLTLRKTRIGRGIYVLVMGDCNNEEMALEAFDAGADDMLAKPVAHRLLLARLSAGKRLSSLHGEIEQDREEIRHFAAELAVSNRRLQEVALTDALTGFPNRRFFSERLVQEWAASLRSKRPLACIMLDVDHFKQINDTYGHDAGDSALRQVAVAIRSAVRTHDLVARMGGDEFVVLCPDSSIEAAMVCAERVRRAVDEAQLSSGLLHLKLSVSAGVSCRDAAIPDAESLLKRADQGLYMAKQAGRNRVAAPQLRPAGSGMA